MRIAHFADIHWRLKDRHEEYTQVFNRVYKTLELLSVDRIVLVGDIIHSKTVLSPELIEEVRNMFIEFEKIAPVDVIVGNHDMNGNNLTRLDSLTPILNPLIERGLRINYFKNSGIYRIEDTNFHYSVFSLLDNETPKLTKEQIESNDVYIALYHGIIAGSKFDNNYVFSDATMSLSTFRGFDYVMLGDIHLCQFLNPERTAAYAGSLIQQSFGENLQKGFLLWDIEDAKNHTVEHIKVKNDYGFATIYAEKDVLPDIELPSKCKIRVFWEKRREEITRKEVAKLNSLIYEKYNPTFVQILFKPKEDNLGNDLTIKDDTDFADADIQKDLLLQWIATNQYDVYKEDLIKVNQEIDETLPETNLEDFSRQLWHINKVTLCNFMSYGDVLSVDFNKHRGIIGLFGDNRAGKSALVDAISYALFNKITRNVKNEALINTKTDAKECQVELDITIGGVEYHIVRKTTLIYQKTSGKYSGSRTDLSLKRRYNDDTEWEDLNGEQRTETEKIIRNAIGSFDDFILTTLSKRDSKEEFLDKNATPRFENILRFLGLESFGIKYDLAKDKLKKLDKLQATHSKGDVLEKLDFIESSIKEERVLLADVEENVVKYKAVKQGYNDEISKYREMINSAIKITRSEEDLKIERESLKARINELEKQQDSLTASATTLLVKIGDIDREYVLDEETLRHYIEQKQDYTLKTNELRKLETDIASTESVIALLEDDIKTDKECPVAYDPKHSRCAYLFAYYEKKTTLNKQKERLLELKKKLTLIHVDMSKLEIVFDVLDEQDIIKDKLAEATNRVEKIHIRIDAAKNEIDIKKMALKIVIGQLDLIKANKSVIETNNKCRYEIAGLEEKIYQVKRELEDLDNRKIICSENIAVLTAERNGIAEHLSVIETTEVEHRLYTIYCSAMHRTGIPLSIVKQYLPKLNYEINKTLSEVVDFGLYLKIDDNSTDIDIVMRENGKTDDTRTAQLACGMERVLINFAIRYALLSITNLSRASVWIIDEGFSSLDNTNIHLMERFFSNVLDTFRNIVIITHVEELKDVANHIYLVSKVNGISQVILSH